MPPPLIVHFHLFKNAGTSVDEALKANFESAWFSHDTDDPGGSVYPEALAAIVADRPDLMAFSSHQLRPPLPDVGRDIVPIVLLRDPIDRIRSIYRFDRRRGPVTPAAEIANRHDFVGYVRSMLRERPQVVGNGQCMLLTDAWNRTTGRRQPIGARGHFERAMAFVETLPVVGVVEQYGATWDALLGLIRPHHPDFAVDAEVRHNADSARSDSLDDRLAEIRSEIGDDLYDELADANSFDSQLHAWATSRLERTAT